jgi:nucleotide-binding universal stress UspA family protein
MKVLLGTGGSADSFRALERAVERAREAGDDLTIAVLDNPESPTPVDEVEREVRERLEAAGFDATVRRLEGDPGSRLVDVAEREGFDRIVLGGGETSPLGKIKVGHIAEFVVLNASVSVTLVR